LTRFSKPVRRSVALSVAGVVVGVGASFYLTRCLESLLFGVKATDAASFLVSAATLLAVAVAAAYLPARRAAKVDPAIVLRAD
jgi:putative ABC transport system permease protein